MCCPVHDAFLISAPIDRLEADTAAMRAIMSAAAEAIIGIPTPQTRNRAAAGPVHGQARESDLGQGHGPADGGREQGGLKGREIRTWLTWWIGAMCG